MYKVNIEIAREILTKIMPEWKKNALRDACRRNALLTSYYGLEDATMTVYKEGFELEFQGCATSFRVYVSDNDGELVFSRKPPKTKLHRLYWDYCKTNNIINLDTF